jgi:hypothetical protein
MSTSKLLVVNIEKVLVESLKAMIPGFPNPFAVAVEKYFIYPQKPVTSFHASNGIYFTGLETM